MEAISGIVRSIRRRFERFFFGWRRSCPLVRLGLKGPDRWIALEMATYLNSSELMQLFAELVEGASTGHGYVHLYRSLILSLPHDWVKERIEAASERWLREGTMDEYRRFLELYIELDPELTRTLANRALKHPDPDVREAGEDFLDVLQETDPTEGQ